MRQGNDAIAKTTTAQQQHRHCICRPAVTDYEWIAHQTMAHLLEHARPMLARAGIGTVRNGQDVFVSSVVLCDVYLLLISLLATCMQHTRICNAGGRACVSP
jgi:hypothetical protein